MIKLTQNYILYTNLYNHSCEQLVTRKTIEYINRVLHNNNTHTVYISIFIFCFNLLQRVSTYNVQFNSCAYTIVLSFQISIDNIAL